LAKYKRRPASGEWGRHPARGKSEARNAPTGRQKHGGTKIVLSYLPEHVVPEIRKLAGESRKTEPKRSEL
jgi:hypothetical protein